ncbi:MAG: RagB/SusD family nutrient uptake outer membrane protein [Prevotellaceae bacterium]|nr:RagB/SusD family nutrient uptake outer membrane protein [Prevotellaceae bacterium]
MKKIFFTLILPAVLLMAGCKDYLEVDHLLEKTLDIEGVFASRDYSDEWLAGVYSHLKGGNMDVSSKRAAPFNLISDDMYFNDNRKSVDNGENYQKYKNGEYSEGDRQTWGSCYQGIRDASTYILHIDECGQLTDAEITDRKAQARFVRAYLYWLLLRKYGPIPLLPEEGLDFTQDYEDLAIPRNTYVECATYITDELALAARDLNVNRDTRNMARPTKGAALAARAKVFLYAASPLFNGNTDAWAAQVVDDEGKRLISATVDETLWAKAAAAAKEVIDLGIYRLYTVPVRDTAGNHRGYNKWMDFDYYYYPKTITPPHHPEYSDKNFPDGWRDIDPFESYRQLFNGGVQASANPELIFTRGYNQQGNDDILAMALHQMPRSLGGWNTHGLTLKMYEAYYMKDGTGYSPPDASNLQYTDTAPASPNYYANYLPLPPRVSLMHANREPRFYASVAYNGSIWECDGNILADAQDVRYKQVFYYRDAEDGKLPGETQFYLPTGIGIKKYYHPYDWTFMSSSAFMRKPEPAIRYAEVLLIYAEALNELNGAYSVLSYDGASSIAVSRDPAEMSRAVKQVRIRAGLPDFGQDIYSSQAKFREKLKQERQIELMGEGHRYFDLRRWKDAPTEEAAPIWGFNMNMPTAQRTMFDQPVEILSMPTVFLDKMYLWPISHNELRRNRRLTQNPGWTYFTE